MADDLETRISKGEIPVGERLPTERDLAAEYGVSRTCIREALLAMEIAGLVSIRVGTGVFVNAPVTPDISSTEVPTDQRSPSELLEARLIIEPEICALAASRADPEDLESIAECLQVMREEHRMAADTERGDREFHRRIARAASNSMLQEMVGRIWDEMNGPMWQSLQKHVRSPVLRLKWIEDHELILDALRAGDRRRARSAMKQHIERITEVLEKAKFL